METIKTEWLTNSTTKGVDIGAFNVDIDAINGFNDYQSVSKSDTDSQRM